MTLSIYDRFITQTDSGEIVPNAVVTVTRASGGGSATLWQDKAGTIRQGNPITATPLGRVTFYLTPGLYNIQADLGGNTVTYSDVIISAEDQKANRDLFIDGVDFTAGVTTELTLSTAPNDIDNTIITFDEEFIGPDKYSLSGTTLTFNAPITSGVFRVYVWYGVAISQNYFELQTEEYDSVAALIASSPSTDSGRVIAYNDGWQDTDAGPIGGFDWHKTGGTNASPTVGTAVSAGSIGGGDGTGDTTGQRVQAGYFWCADGTEVKIAIDDSTTVLSFGADKTGVLDSTQAFKDYISISRTFPGNSAGIQKLNFGDGDFTVSDTLLFENGRYTLVEGTAVISADMDKPIIALDGCLWLRFTDISLIQANSGSSSGCLKVDDSYIVSFERMYMAGGDKVVNHVTGNNVIYDKVSIRDGNYNFYTLSAGNNTSNAIINSAIERATTHNLHFGFNAAAYGTWSVEDCYIEGNSTGQIYIQNLFDVQIKHCYINQLSSDYSVLIDGTTANVRCKFIDCEFTATSAVGTVYAFRNLSSSTVRSAIVDDACRLGTNVAAYNESDTYIPSLIAESPRFLNPYNLEHLIDSAGTLAGFSEHASAAYTFGVPFSDRGDQSINLTAQYVYKTITLKKGVTYQFRVTAKNTGAGTATFSLFTSGLGGSVKSETTTSASAVDIGFDYTPTSTAQFELLLRNSGTTNAEFSGCFITSYESTLHI